MMDRCLPRNSSFPGERRAKISLLSEIDSLCMASRHSKCDKGGWEKQRSTHEIGAEIRIGDGKIPCLLNTHIPQIIM
ncbi:hypothetical protein GcM1_230035 [Golovinomyces cichoracearum]|uniref:Uncharacterized protein n=1 Tax=Golovinomyces cichoracearum TaxID=62708 RepID=A0A420IN67_9PEZI|nr:hypothetical protein GcM1_230035 [Golovinomyces cichoracearum]